MGRFINADTITDGYAKIIGNNLFLYAANNPMNNSDPSGNWIIKDLLKKVVEKIVKPNVKKVQEHLSKTDTTRTQGLSANVSTGIWNFNLQGGLSVDTKGNVAIQGTIAGGVTANSTPTVSVGAFSMVTNAPSINKLNGQGYQLGGSACFPIAPLPVSLSAGGEFNIIPDIEQNTNYYGITTFVGVAPPLPSLELHAEWGETYSASFQFNIFDIMKNAYVKIMEW